MMIFNQVRKPAECSSKLPLTMLAMKPLSIGHDTLPNLSPYDNQVMKPKVKSTFKMLRHE
jgi:hypothetical protein